MKLNKWWSAIIAVAIVFVPIFVVGGLPVRLTGAAISHTQPPLSLEVLRLYLLMILELPVMLTLFTNSYVSNSLGWTFWITPTFIALLMFVTLQHDCKSVVRKVIMWVLVSLVLLFVAVMRDGYEVWINPLPNAEFQHVEPLTRLTATQKTLQAITETPGCEYEILGWTSNNLLAYQRWCEGKFSLIGDQFIAGLPESPQLYDPNLSKMISDASNTNSLIRQYIGTCSRPTWKDLEFFSIANSAYPIPNARDNFYSPDGKWVAFTRRHIYGPVDLLVFRCSS